MANMSVNNTAFNEKKIGGTLLHIFLLHRSVMHRSVMYYRTPHVFVDCGLVLDSTSNQERSSLERVARIHADWDVTLCALPACLQPCPPFARCNNSTWVANTLERYEPLEPEDCRLYRPFVRP